MSDNIPIYPEHAIINFRHLIKNRLGPYKIVVRRDDGEYLLDNSKWISKLQDAFVYYTHLDAKQSDSYSPLKDIARFGGKIYLTTLAGEIELKKSNFFPKYQEGGM